MNKEICMLEEIEIEHVKCTDNLNDIYDNLFLGFIENNFKLNSDYKRFFKDTLGIVNIIERIKSNYSYIATDYSKDIAVPVGLLIGNKINDVISIDCLYVLPKYRKNGIGTRLLNQFIKDYGINNIKLKVLSESIEINNLLKKFNFIFSNVIQYRFYDLIDHIYIRKGNKEYQLSLKNKESYKNTISIMEEFKRWLSTHCGFGGKEIIDIELIVNGESINPNFIETFIYNFTNDRFTNFKRKISKELNETLKNIRREQS